MGACLPAGDFACEQSGQCSRLAEGACEPSGYCSYPDGGCGSGRRYSGFAGALAGACVDAEGTATEGGTAETGPLPDSCDGVDCSGLGTCVMVDDQPTCACDPGLYPVGLACREDPCEVARCRFVDVDEGDDANEGTREAPWRTIGRLVEGIAEAEPGEHFLLRRGREWEGPGGNFDIEAVSGTAARPVVVGAYGPVSDPAPRLLSTAVKIDQTDHLVLRDLWIEDSSGPCIRVSDSDYVILQGNVALRCGVRGIRVDSDSGYSVIVDNVVSDPVSHSGIFVADTHWENKEEIESHHWIIDNVVIRPKTDGIAVNDSSEPGMERTTTDVKIVGNRLADVPDLGIRLSIWGEGWVVGNTIARAGSPEIGSSGAIGMFSDGVVSGNVVLSSHEGIELRNTGRASHNTLVHDGALSALVVHNSAEAYELTHNLVLARGGASWLSLSGSDPDDDVAALGAEWYATEGEPCRLEALGSSWDLPGFIDATGLGDAVVCGPVPDFGSVPAGLGPDAWDEAFWASLRPGPGWERCDDPAGAFDCEGRPLAEIVPLPQLSDGGGLGWAGPLVVRQRYDTSP